MNYWLMKSEPSDYSITDLKRDGVEMWDGIRNYQVRNMMRDDMKVGDLALFYHSNTDEIGVVGTMQIVSKAYPDPTQFDPTLTFSSPLEVAALKRIVNSNKSPNVKVFLKPVGKNNTKVRVGVDPKSGHPDPKSDPENPRWLCVDVKFKTKFPHIVTLAELKSSSFFNNMMVTRKGIRLSVQPVMKRYFNRIIKLSKT